MSVLIKTFTSNQQRVIPPWVVLTSTMGALGLLIIGTLASSARGERVVPGTGIRLMRVGDDLEDENWQYQRRGDKSSRNIDEKERAPVGRSANGRWSEGPHRGQPDLVKRIPTPPGGLAASEGSLLIRTLKPGVPGELSYKPQQDDLILDVKKRLGESIDPSSKPNCVTRVYLPDFEYWEKRTGSHFGFRLDTWGRKELSFRTQQYWPGIFINLRSASDDSYDENSAFLTIRANGRGRDIKGPEIKDLGWWTLGLSVCPDGMIHFYASPGVDDLTAEDYLTSQYCYGFRCRRVDLFFFNVVTTDDGKSKSTPWIVDDPMFYVSSPRMAAGFNDNRLR